jgi:hypothetical protein
MMWVIKSESTGYFSHLELWILEQPMLFSPNKIKVVIERRYNISDHILDQILPKKKKSQFFFDLAKLFLKKSNTPCKILSKFLKSLKFFFDLTKFLSLLFFVRIWSKMWSEMLYLLSIMTLILLGLNSIGCSKIHNSRCEKYPVLSLIITYIIN